ncbi:hypothetical protein HOLleu_37627 [Holothuria leucospilota]|uniref:Reverse transcriptase domain-containing protein n=1 Tax=Holothuria leucospilota TaxID=206669 RepID=A0A9Q0YHF7_HOLLE|nr:hypothetical protein HOLleu_37627 [Holothuria leucospilota]
MNDLRPVALTSIAMKTCERFILQYLKEATVDFMDDLQFAYRKDRNTEDAILYTLDNLYSHLEDSRFGTVSARIMFFDFSSAFNTIKPHILADILLKTGVLPCASVKWILHYLTNRTQFVRINYSVSSDITHCSTGVPQGTVLAPFLFTLYTAGIRSDDPCCPLIKFADDAALIGLIRNDDDSSYRQQVFNFVNKVERVNQYKYLGVMFDHQLRWDAHVDYVSRRLKSRMYCLRYLRSFNVNQDILLLFYNSIICSVWSYSIISWSGNATKSLKVIIDNFVKKASRIVGVPLPTVDTVYENRVHEKLISVLKDNSHPMFSKLNDSIIPRSGRMRPPRTHTNRYPSSFLCQAIRIFNLNFTR